MLLYKGKTDMLLSVLLVGHLFVIRMGGLHDMASIWQASCQAMALHTVMAQCVVP